MKLTIAVFTVLVVGSNAGLLGNLVNPITDSAAAVKQANVLLSSFLSDVDEVVVSLKQNISQQVQTVTETYNGFLNGTLSVAQVHLTASEVAELTIEVTEALSDLLGNTTALVAKTSAIVIGLETQLTSTIAPYIIQLGSKVLTGALKVTCFNKAVPDVQSKMSGLVAGIQSSFVKLISDNFDLIEADIQLVQSIVDGIQNSIQTKKLDIVSIF